MDPSRPAKFDRSPDRRRRESDEEDEDESTVRVPNRDRSRQRRGTDRRRREPDEEDKDENTVRVPNRDRSRQRRGTDRRRQESDEEDENESTVRVPNRDRSRRHQDTDRRRRESEEEDESTVRVPNRDQSRRRRGTDRIRRELYVEDESSVRVSNRDRSRSPREQRQLQDDGRLERLMRRVNQHIANWNQQMGDPTNQSAPGSPGQQPSDTSGTQPLRTYDIDQVVDQYSQVGQQIAEISDQCPIGTPQAGQTGAQSMTELETEVQRYIQTAGPSAHRSTPVRPNPNQQSGVLSGRNGSNDTFLDDSPNEEHRSDMVRRISGISSLDETPPTFIIHTPPPGSPNVPGYRLPLGSPNFPGYQPPGSPNVPGYRPLRTPPPGYRTPPPRYALQSSFATNTPQRFISYSPSSFPVSPPPAYTRPPPPAYTRLYHPPA